MSLFAAWILYPAVLALLCAGVGLLFDLIGGRRVPGALVLPLGFAGIVVAGQFTTRFGATAELTVPLLLALAVLGFGLTWPWRFGWPDPPALAVVLGVLAVFAAPVVLSGHPTFAGYVKLDDTATWLALTDRVLEHGRDLGGLEPSSYRATLEFNLADGYPVGVFIPFGVAQKLVGGDLAWVFQPYLGFLAAMISLCLWQILGGVTRRGSLRACGAILAAQPALLYGYAMWGGVKEVAAAALIALAAAIAPGAVRRDGSPVDLLALAVVGAALIGVLSPGGILWLLPMLVLLFASAVAALGLSRALTLALWFGALLALLSLPVFSSGLVPPTSSPLTDPDAQGNLLGPLNSLQVVGIWPSGDFRVDPEQTVLTAVLVGLGILAALLGLVVAWRQRLPGLVLLASTLLAAAAIIVVGSPWAGGKALATASPVFLCLAVTGAIAAMRVDRLAGGILLTVIAAGALLSNLMAYGGVNLAPYGELVELEQIGKSYAGEGPALMTEYNPYGARHFLREMNAEGVSELRNRTIPLARGGEVPKGYSADTDELQMSSLFLYRTLVLRRSPLRSRPPYPYRPVWAGRYYEVWQRPEGRAEPPLGFLALGGRGGPGGIPDCAEVVALGRRAQLEGGEGTRLLAAPVPPVFTASGGLVELPARGRYEAWVAGSVRGTAELIVDGRLVGKVRHAIENEGSLIRLGEAELDGGRHQVTLDLGGADLHPGSGGFPRPATGPVLLRAADSGEELVAVPTDAAASLCGRRWDWVAAEGSR